MSKNGPYFIAALVILILSQFLLSLEFGRKISALSQLIEQRDAAVFEANKTISEKMEFLQRDLKIANDKANLASVKSEKRDLKYENISEKFDDFGARLDRVEKMFDFAQSKMSRLEALLQELAFRDKQKGDSAKKR